MYIESYEINILEYLDVIEDHVELLLRNYNKIINSIKKNQNEGYIIYQILMQGPQDIKTWWHGS